MNAARTSTVTEPRVPVTDATSSATARAWAKSTTIESADVEPAEEGGALAASSRFQPADDDTSTESSSSELPASTSALTMSDATRISMMSSTAANTVSPVRNGPSPYTGLGGNSVW